MKRENGSCRPFDQPFKAWVQRMKMLLTFIVCVFTFIGVKELSYAQAQMANLLRNPGAEEGAGGESDADVVSIPGWTTTSNFTVLVYGGSGGTNPTKAESQRINGGNNFFAGGPSNPESSAQQLVDVSSKAANIDAGQRIALLRAHLAGFGS